MNNVIYQCFSGKLFKFLINEGHEVLCTGLHCTSKHRFWIFENTEKLSVDLKRYTTLTKHDSRK